MFDPWLKEWFAFWGGWFGMDTSNRPKAEVHSIFHRVTHRSSTCSQVQGKWCSVAMQNHSHSTTCCHKHTQKRPSSWIETAKKKQGDVSLHPSFLSLNGFSRNVEPKIRSSPFPSLPHGGTFLHQPIHKAKTGHRCLLWKISSDDLDVSEKIVGFYPQIIH